VSQHEVSLPRSIPVDVIHWLLFNILSCNFCLKDISQWSFARIDICTFPKGFEATFSAMLECLRLKWENIYPFSPNASLRLDAPPKTIHNFAQALFPKED
jgi:hypothetical protein